MRTISASVGQDGKNVKSDVMTVQDLLNKVPVHEGGPQAPLKVDGLAWTKTIAAIKRFQSINLGHKWPDGRVDPGGKTLAKLNQYDVLPPGPPPPPANARKVSTLFRIRGLDNIYRRDPQMIEKDAFDYFEITDLVNARRAVYVFYANDVGYVPRIVEYTAPQVFHTIKPLDVVEFAVPAAWTTVAVDPYQKVDPLYFSTLELALPGGGVITPVYKHQKSEMGLGIQRIRRTQTLFMVEGPHN
jgi:hypothetical protein